MPRKKNTHAIINVMRVEAVAMLGVFIAGVRAVAQRPRHVDVITRIPADD